jgi:hypothetical protein
VLIDYRNAGGIGEWEPSWWQTCAFIGVTERADGSKSNPTGSMILDRDACEIDEIRCVEVTQ